MDQVPELEALRSRLLSDAERLRSKLTIIEAKLEAIDLIEEDLKPKEELGSITVEVKRSMLKREVVAFAKEMHGSFTHSDLTKHIEEALGQEIEPVGVRVWLNRLAQEDDHIVKVVEPGTGRKPSRFQLTEESV